MSSGFSWTQISMIWRSAIPNKVAENLLEPTPDLKALKFQDCDPNGQICLDRIVIQNVGDETITIEDVAFNNSAPNCKVQKQLPYVLPLGESLAWMLIPCSVVKLEVWTNHGLATFRWQ
jgi:hypothetical protein